MKQQIQWKEAKKKRSHGFLLQSWSNLRGWRAI